MIDGVTERLATYRSGIERISALINRRAELIVALPPLREKFDAADRRDAPIPRIASTLFQTQSRIASALLARNPSAAEQAAQSMRSMTITEPKLRAAVDDYAEAIIGDLDPRAADRRYRQGGAGHRGPPDPARHRIVARGQRRGAATFCRAISPGR